MRPWRDYDCRDRQVTVSAETLNDRSCGSYVALSRSGELRRRVVEAVAGLRACRACPRECSADRSGKPPVDDGRGRRGLRGGLGFCRTGRLARVASYGPHFGEEAPLVGQGGSGTIFFSYCNLACVFCQNWEISHGGEGEEVTAEELATMMLRLQQRGCHNINLVSPSHVVPQVLEAVEIAAQRGLTLPLVYNTGGYDAVKTLQLLDGVVDIYMPDAKYANEVVAAGCSGVPDYVMRNRAAILEMHRQVGDLVIDGSGVAVRGLLVRHLVLPGGLAGTADVMSFLARQVSPDTYVNIMAQYHPAGAVLLPAALSAENVEKCAPNLRRRITSEDYRGAAAAARDAGLWRLDR